jgi:hypothetical protein
MNCTDDVEETNPEIHMGDIGTEFIITIHDENDYIQDLSLATTFELIFISSANIIKSRIPHFYTDGKDGILVYTFANGDLDVHGLWHYQIKIAFPSSVWSTNVEDFKVYPNI